jgi:hypothetical protein
MGKRLAQKIAQRKMVVTAGRPMLESFRCSRHFPVSDLNSRAMFGYSGFAANYGINAQPAPRLHRRPSAIHSSEGPYIAEFAELWQSALTRTKVMPTSPVLEFGANSLQGDFIPVTMSRRRIFTGTFPP